MQSHDKWLLKAENDLNAAKILYKANCLDVAIYHTQQCAEKALKGYLALKNHPLIKTHDLVSLVALCTKYNPKFSKITQLAGKLTPFATMFRYPDIDVYPKKSVVLAALREAEQILRFIGAEISKNQK